VLNEFYDLFGLNSTLTRVVLYDPSPVTFDGKNSPLAVTRESHRIVIGQAIRGLALSFTMCKIC